MYKYSRYALILSQISLIASGWLWILLKKPLGYKIAKCLSYSYYTDEARQVGVKKDAIFDGYGQVQITRAWENRPYPSVLVSDGMFLKAK